MAEEEEEGGVEISARQKVAILMIALGQETTAEVMKYLTDFEIEGIAQAIAEDAHAITKCRQDFTSAAKRDLGIET